MSALAEDALDRLRAAHPGEHLYAPSEIRAAITGALVEREVALLTTRERLREALHELRWRIMEDPEAAVESLIEQEGVIDATTLADNDTVYDAVENAVMVEMLNSGLPDGPWVTVTYAALHALGEALTKRGEE